MEVLEFQVDLNQNLKLAKMAEDQQKVPKKERKQQAEYKYAIKRPNRS